MDARRAGAGGGAALVTGAPELTVVMPVHHEGERVVPVIESLARQLELTYEILVVYDTPDDPTLPHLERLRTRLPAVRPHRNTLGPGVLNALRSGLDAARGRWILVSMADGSDDPSSLPLMLALARDGADLVAASRYSRGGRQVGAPMVKSVLSRLAGLTLHLLVGIPTRDATNNFKLYSRRLLDAVRIESRAGFELALELTTKAHLLGYRIEEVPTVWREREAGRSRFRLRAWLPHYLRWYVTALRWRISGGRGRPISR